MEKYIVCLLENEFNIKDVDKKIYLTLDRFFILFVIQLACLFYNQETKSQPNFRYKSASACAQFSHKGSAKCTFKILPSLLFTI